MKLEYDQIQKTIKLHSLFLIGDQEGIRADFNHADLYGANLANTNLQGGDFACANLKRSLLCDANLAGADFSGAYFKHAVLEGANLRGAIFTGANLKGANLERTDMRGALLCGADLCDASISYSVYDETTVWPDNYDPVTRGAIYLAR